MPQTPNLTDRKCFGDLLQTRTTQRRMTGQGMCGTSSDLHWGHFPYRLRLTNDADATFPI